jgi:hypothetical protein
MISSAGWVVLALSLVPCGCGASRRSADDGIDSRPDAGAGDAGGDSDVDTETGSETDEPCDMPGTGSGMSACWFYCAGCFGDEFCRDEPSCVSECYCWHSVVRTGGYAGLTSCLQDCAETPTEGCLESYMEGATSRAEDAVLSCQTICPAPNAFCDHLAVLDDGFLDEAAACFEAADCDAMQACLEDVDSCAWTWFWPWVWGP